MIKSIKKFLNIKIVLFIMLAILVGIIVKANVTIIKEPDNPEDTSFNLETSSEIVQEVYSGLILTDRSSFEDPTYSNMYFVFDGEEKKLKNDEKLYLVLEKLYEENAFGSELEEDIETLQIDIEKVVSTYENMFEDKINLQDIEYKVSSNRGIIEYQINEDKVNLKVKRLNQEKIRKSIIESASKNGDYIELKIKSLIGNAIVSKETNEKFYDIRNYGVNKVLVRVPAESSLDEVFKKDEVNSYVFTFVLNGEKYYLESIKKGETGAN